MRAMHYTTVPGGAYTYIFIQFGYSVIQKNIFIPPWCPDDKSEYPLASVPEKREKENLHQEKSIMLAYIKFHAGKVSAGLYCPLKGLNIHTSK